MRERTDDAWFTNWRNAADQVGQITLVCLPHAGAGASPRLPVLIQQSGACPTPVLEPPSTPAGPRCSPRGLTSSESPCLGASPGSASPR